MKAKGGNSWNKIDIYRIDIKLYLNSCISHRVSLFAEHRIDFDETIEQANRPFNNNSLLIRFPLVFASLWWSPLAILSILHIVMWSENLEHWMKQNRIQRVFYTNHKIEMISKKKPIFFLLFAICCASTTTVVIPTSYNKVIHECMLYLHW